MAAQITCEVMVGLTPKIRDAVENACEDIGLKPSQFMRQAAVEKLAREGYLSRPNFQRFNKLAPELKAAE